MSDKNGHFVISLDYELHWGIFDKRSVSSYEQNLKNTRKAIEKLLVLSDKYDIKLTFATVGFLFAKDKNILCIATNQETAKNMVTKVKFMYENLPSWLKVDADENNKLTLRLKNGSQIKATSASSDAGRSEAVSLLLIDEAAFIDNIGEIWASAQQTLATGGGCIALSTPYGTGNWFHQTWARAEAAENEFLPIKLPWYVHPERDQAWRDRQDELLGDPRMAAQECDCDFSTSGDIVFYPEYIEYYEKSYIKDPMEKRGADQNLWVWESPDYTRDYIVVADVSRGDGKDYSACHVIDVANNVQVAEQKGQLGTKEYGHLLVGLATEYNEAMLVIENANIGLIQFCLSAPKTEMENSVVVNEYSAMDRIITEERNYIVGLVKKIRAAKCNVLLIQKSILNFELDIRFLEFCPVEFLLVKQAIKILYFLLKLFPL